MSQVPKFTPAYRSIADRLIVALDVSGADEALEVVRELSGHVGGFKVGLQLFTLAGPEFVTRLCGSGAKVFLDLKFHDIPSTVANACVAAARLGVWMLNVHTAGGSEMMKRAVSEVGDFCSRSGIEPPRIVGVTVLTSSDAGVLSETGIDGSVTSHVVRLSRLAAECGLDGVVTSAVEAAEVRRSIRQPRFLIVSPGIRPSFATNDDQKRVTTPTAALNAGADYLVVGRPVIAADDRIAAVRNIYKEIEALPHA